MSEYRLKNRDVTYVSIDEMIQQDGRARVCAVPVLGPKREVTFSVAMVRHIIQRFLETGHSNHSAIGGCLPFIIDYCEAHKIPYTLRAAFTKEGQHCGYYIVKDKYLGEERERPTMALTSEGVWELRFKEVPPVMIEER